jgi:hypothetical protein
MKKLTVTLCLTLAVLLGSEMRGSDLSPYPEDNDQINNLSEIRVLEPEPLP